MGDRSGIQWTDATWNPMAGCSPVSEGCRNCYAAKEALRLSGHPNAKVRAKYEGTARKTAMGRPVFTGLVNMAPEETITQPLRWTRPRRVFVNSMSDLFHPMVEVEDLDRLFAVMALSPQHTFQVLTKRPDLAEAYLGDRSQGRRDSRGEAVLRMGGITDGLPWPLPNVWVGTSVENQETADERIPHLYNVPAAVRFLSMEPLLGPVDLTQAGAVQEASGTQHVRGYPEDVDVTVGLVDWIIIGGESGPNARRFNLAWARDIIRQARACDPGQAPAVFVKQLGARPEVVEAGFHDPEAPEGPRTCRVSLQDRKGGDPEEWPEDLRVQEFPVEEWSR